MQQDRIITWSKSKGRRRPIANTLTKSVREFFGPRGPTVETDNDRLYIATSAKHWIEVELDVGTVNVITRNADADTFTMANDLAAHIARTYRGGYKAPPEPKMVRDARQARVEKYLQSSPEAFYDDPDFD